MKPSPEQMEKVGRLVGEALTEVQNDLHGWPHAPHAFTSETELQDIATKLREVRQSLHEGQVHRVLGLWPVIEPWPRGHRLRTKIVEAEYEYTQLMLSPAGGDQHVFNVAHAATKLALAVPR